MASQLPQVPLLSSSASLTEINQAVLFILDYLERLRREAERSDDTVQQSADEASTTAGEKVSKSGDTMTGLLTLSADPSSALHAATKQYVDNLPDPIFTEAFTSTEQTITAAGALTLAHGLSAEPSLIQLYLVNVTAEHGYSSGDKVLINPILSDGATSRGIVIVPDATNINVRFGNNGNSYTVLSKADGTGQAITNANWRLVVRAWA